MPRCHDASLIYLGIQEGLFHPEMRQAKARQKRLFWKSWAMGWPETNRGSCIPLILSLSIDHQFKQIRRQSKTETSRDSPRPADRAVIIKGNVSDSSRLTWSWQLLEPYRTVDHPRRWIAEGSLAKRADGGPDKVPPRPFNGGGARQ
ncbi:hypothetical protein UVI_02058830 [Ustilaginoidea virens]|uniref:Uncharacterized protein n=1 Tax=Ustilaginoidea virens TaxID=1159556 RepID=A0A1B5L5V1_USTVR|nr:hypothetical protein UVI_02058830 [Ustilaginoidea virens]